MLLIKSKVVNYCNKWHLDVNVKKTKATLKCTFVKPRNVSSHINIGLILHSIRKIVNMIND